MTYLELADKSARDLDRGKITLGEYEERIKPLRVEIKPWNGWISTSERLPEKFENVLLSTNGGLVEEGFYFETTEFHAIWKGVVTHGTYWDDEITAWMPLPKPYKKEGEPNG